MAINFKKIAQRETVLSSIMENRTKVDKTNGKFHISEFDIVANKKGEAYAICAISDTEFINGGFVLTKVFTSIVEEFNGNLERAREEFMESGGLDVELRKSKTSSGHDITIVSII